MKLFLATACLLITSNVFATEVQNVRTTGSTYEVFHIFETNVKKATLLVDYKQVVTDCHGVDFSYEVTQLNNGNYLVKKNPLMKPAVMCPTDETFVVQDGLKLDLPVNKRTGSSSLVAEIIAPADSNVEVQIER